VSYSDSVVIGGSFKDSSGNPLRLTAVLVSVNGVSGYARTDANGVFSYSYKTNTVGVNNVSVSYEGNTNYANAAVKTTFKVTTKPTLITINKINQVKKGNAVNISGKFTDNSGKPLKYTTLTLKVNGVNYYSKTDESGLYSFSYKTTTIGTNKVVVSYGGNLRYGSNSTQQSFIVIR